MPATEQYQTDVFAIITAIVAVLVLVFLIVDAVYFNGIQNWTSIPSGGESTFLFWTAIVLSVIVGAITIYAFYRIFTHRAIVCPKILPPSRIITPTKPTIPVANPPTAAPTIEHVQSAPVTVSPIAPVQSAPITVQPTATAGYPTAVTTEHVQSQLVPGYPTATSTQTALQNELLNLSAAQDA